MSLKHYELIQKIADHADKPCFAADIVDVLTNGEALVYFGISDAGRHVVESAYNLVLQCHKNNPFWVVQPVIEMTPRVF